MLKAVVISGYLHGVSDNIVPFLGKDTDLFIHTWDTPENKRWINKIKRYGRYCNKLEIITEQQKYSRKLYSYFYSTWKVITSIENIEQYSKVIKFKPNLNAEKIPYVGDLEYYYNKARIQSRPLLNGTAKEECLYGPIYYKTMDERLFSGYPLAFKKAFKLPMDDFLIDMHELNKKLTDKYGEDYEGSIFWKKWFNKHGVTLIHDIDLILPNNKD